MFLFLLSFSDRMLYRILCRVIHQSSEATGLSFVAKVTMNHSQSHTLEQPAADKMAYLTAVSYDLLYNPLSCKTGAFTLVLLEAFCPPIPFAAHSATHVALT